MSQAVQFLETVTYFLEALKENKATSGAFIFATNFNSFNKQPVKS